MLMSTRWSSSIRPGEMERQQSIPDRVTFEQTPDNAVEGNEAGQGRPSI
jgi:hypothetical protein